MCTFKDGGQYTQQHRLTLVCLKLKYIKSLSGLSVILEMRTLIRFALRASVTDFTSHISERYAE